MKINNVVDFFKGREIATSIAKTTNLITTTTGLGKTLDLQRIDPTAAGRVPFCCIYLLVKHK